MAVKDELTGCGAGRGDAQTVDDVVETAFEKLEQNLTGDAFCRGGFVEEVAELTLENSVGIFGFLLFAQLSAILRGFAATVGAMLSGRGLTAKSLFT